MLSRKVLEEKYEDKYLGDMLSSRGLADSVDSTVKEREAKVKGSIHELRAIAEDFHMLAVGGIESAIDPYKSCIVPSLVAKYSTWTEIEKGLMPHRVFSDVSSYMFRSLPPGWQLKLP